MKIKKTLFTLAILLSIIQLFGQHSKKYPMYRSTSYYGTNSNIIWLNGIQKDTLARNLGIKEQVKIETNTHKNKTSIEGHSKVEFDNLGRVIETHNMNKYGDWFYKADYSQKNKRIVTTKTSYSESVRNDSNRVIRTYYEHYKKNGAIYAQYLNTNTYKYDKWITAAYSNPSKKDTNSMQIKTKYYYDNDSGDLMKKELFKKGKVNYTYVYDCSLAEKTVIPKKDTTRICQNQATDDRGYTYYTRYFYKDSKTYKSVSVTDPKNILVERYTYIVDKDIELPTYIYKNTKDSLYRVYIRYSKNLKKQNYKTVSTSHKNTKGRTTRIVSQYYIKNKKANTNYRYRSFYKNGLIKSSIQESISAKGKIYAKRTSHYYYTYFNS